MDWDTAKAVAGDARLLRRAAGLVQVRADSEEGLRPSATVLIIFVLLWMMTREPGLHLSMHKERGY